jgi:hypothetical protein
MLGQFINLGQGQLTGVFAASQRDSRFFGGQHPPVVRLTATKQPSRDFGADIDVPPPGRITSAVLNAII